MPISYLRKLAQFLITAILSTDQRPRMQWKVSAQNEIDGNISKLNQAKSYKKVTDLLITYTLDLTSYFMIISGEPSQHYSLDICLISHQSYIQV